MNKFKIVRRSTGEVLEEVETYKEAYGWYYTFSILDKTSVWQGDLLRSSDYLIEVEAV